MLIVQQLLTQVADMIFPPRCLISGERVAEQGGIAPAVWQRLSFLRNPLCQCCGLPFPHDVILDEREETEDERLCLGCLNKRPNFSLARSALAYDDGSRPLLLKFKHADGIALAPLLARWLKLAGDEALQDSDLLVPVPLHRWRLLKRKYNQAALLTKELSRLSGIPHHPLLLRRERATPSQGGLDRKARRKNVRKAFVVSERYQALIRGKTITLVDDVYTTGATVEECTAALLKAGAKAVTVLCVARVLRPYQVS